MSAVRQSYKQTEVGVIPEEWEPRQLGMIAHLKSGIAITQRDISEEGPYPVYGGNGLRGFTTSTTHFGQHPLIGRQGALCGNVNFVSGHFFASEHAIVATATNRTEPKFLFYALKSFNLNSLSEASAQPGLSVEKLRPLLVASPTNPIEQQAIAEALGDADALIEALEALIAKKRALKRGAMQDLLTGHRRLPGFQGEWDVKRIREVTTCTSGGTPATTMSSFWGGDIPWMSSGELHLRQVYDVAGRITQLGLHNSSAKLIPPNCVLIGLAGQGKTRGTVAINRIPLTTNQSIAAILPSESYVPEYLYHNLFSRYDELREISSGDGGRGGLNLTLIGLLEVPIPTLDEQRAIAAVLSDMDAEIVALEDKLAKARAVKQGMMQVLLTGEIRLV